VLAPTGTIGLLMDCDTTGVEPDFALVKFKKLAGGGYFKIVNQSVPAALRRLGYGQVEIERIGRWAIGTGTLEGAPHVHPDVLLHKGAARVRGPPHRRGAAGHAPPALRLLARHDRDDALTRLGVSVAEREKPGFACCPSRLHRRADRGGELVVCGNLTVEGAPGLKAEHLPVFDCANRCGPRGTRYIEPMATSA